MSLQQLNDALTTVGDNLTTAISGTANNPLSLPPCAVTFSDPPTKSECEALRDWVNSAFDALRRS